MEEEIHKIALHYGYESQSMMLIEEMAELTQAISKIRRAKEPIDFAEAFDSLVEEIADVEIMLEQVKYLLPCGYAVECMKYKKIKRQIERMKNNE